MLIAANFHYIRERFDTPFAGISGVTPTEFEAQLDLLGQSGEFVGAADIAAALEGKLRLPERSVCITFDDGLREQFDLAWPIMHRRGIPGIFFVSTLPIEQSLVLDVHKLHIVRTRVSADRLLDELAAFCDEEQHSFAEIDQQSVAAQYRYDSPVVGRLKYALNFQLPLVLRRRFIDRSFDSHTSRSENEISKQLYMTRQMLRELDIHHVIGSHGHDHAPLAQMPEDHIRAELNQSKSLLQAWGLKNIVSFSYPYGGPTSYSLRVGELAEEAGYRFAFTMERGTNLDLSNPLFLARFSNSDMPGGNSARWSADHLFEQSPRASGRPQKMASK